MGQDSDSGEHLGQKPWLLPFVERGLPIYNEILFGSLIASRE